MRMRTEQGFSLIEIMIGLTVGLVSLLALYQLYAVSEGRQRTAMSLSTAQATGAMALFSIGRDIRSAALGFGGIGKTHLGCTVHAYHGQRTPASFEFRLLPVLIQQGSGDESDTVWVLSGSSSTMVTGVRYLRSGAGTFTLEQSHAGIHAGDVLVGTSDSFSDRCLLMEATAGSGTERLGTRLVKREAVSYRNFYSGQDVQALRNGGNSTSLLDKSDTNLGEGMLYNLGPEPVLHVWGVNGNRSLTRYNHLTEASGQQVEVAQDIIQFKAEYGYDADANGMIDGSTEWMAALPASGVQWERVLAVRIAVLLRSSHYDKAEVTSAKPRWAHGSKEFGMGTAGSDWKHYRYRVYESVISLRNVIWGQAA